MSHRNPNSQIDGKIYNVTFQAHFIHVITSIKFPCLLYVLWKTNDHHCNAETKRYTSQNQKVVFNETITLKVPLVYEYQKKSFLKKETQVQLNLISKNRPDQAKLVGRVTIDLANLLNNNIYQNPTEFPLQFCSVNAGLTASFKVIQKIQTDTSVHELQKSMGESFSFSSNLKPIHPPAPLQKSRDSLSIGLDTPILNSKVLDKNPINYEQQQSRCTSPKSSEHVLNRELYSRQKILLSSQTTQENKQYTQQKNRTKSFSGIKVSNLIENNHNRLQSALAEDSKSKGEALKLRGEIDYLKLESNRQNQQSERIRRELESKLKDSQFIKLQLKQKQASLEQANTENSNLRNQSTRLREEVTRLREEVVAGKIKMAELLDNFNRVSAQLSTSQRQLKRFDILSQQSNQTNKQLLSRVEQLQGLVHESETKCSQLESAKLSLQFAIRQHQDLLRIKEQNIKSLSERTQQQKTFFEQQIQIHKNQLQQHKDICKKYESEMNCMQQQIKRLQAVEHQFQEAKHSWDLTQTILQQQSSRKDERISELEQTLMNINERVRQLQGQNELLTDSCKRTRQQLDKLQEQKVRSLQIAQLKQKEYLSQLQNQKATVERLFIQKSKLQQQITRLNEELEGLSKEYSCISDEYSKALSENKSLTITFNQEQNKNRELQQLLLSAHQQRERELAQASQRENQLLFRVHTLQNQLQNSHQSTTLLQDKSNLLQEELKGRQDLVLRLQEGLNTQIQRTQSLNQKLLSYLQKDQRMKDLMLTIESEQKKITQLINQQQVAQRKNQAIIQQRGDVITDLLQKLQAASKQIADIQLVSKQTENQYTIMLQQLNCQISSLNSKNQELEMHIAGKICKIEQLEGRIVEAEIEKQRSQLQKFQFENDAQAQIDRLMAQKMQMEGTISDLQSNLCAVNIKINEKQALIVKQQQINSQTRQNLQGREILLSELEQKIIERESKLSELQGMIQDLKSQLVLKQQLLEQQSKRFNELQVLYEDLTNDHSTFDLQAHKQEMKEKQATISRLQSQLALLKVQVTKMATLERALKIKTIELNSLKFKGKGEAPQTNELISLKDEEIASLQVQNEKLIKVQSRFLDLQQQITQLRTQLEQIQEQRFNIESLSNERALLLEEAKQQNRKLMDEIMIIGERNGELEKIIFQMTSTQRSEQYQKSDAAIKAENFLLKSQLKDYDNLKNRNRQLQTMNQKHQEQIRYKEKSSLSGKSNQFCSSYGSSDSHTLGNIKDTYNGLKFLLEQRTKGKMIEKTIQVFERVLSRDQTKPLQQKVKLLSQYMNKIKLQLAKNSSNKQGKQIMRDMNNCQQVVSSILSTL